ncbi:hypothetical protein GC177_01055 [bacterium]|nr:hypothetical protein [bacterium]
MTTLPKHAQPYDTVELWTGLDGFAEHAFGKIMQAMLNEDAANIRSVETDNGHELLLLPGRRSYHDAPMWEGEVHLRPNEMAMLRYLCGEAEALGPEVTPQHDDLLWGVAQTIYNEIGVRDVTDSPLGDGRQVAQVTMSASAIMDLQVLTQAKLEHLQNARNPKIIDIDAWS